MRGLAQALANPNDLPRMLGDVLVHCLDAAGLSTGLLYLPQADGKLRLQAQAGVPKDVREAAVECFGHPELLERATAGGQPVAYRFAAETEIAVREFGERLGRASCLIVPFVAAGEPLGGLVMASDSHDLTEPAWRGFASALGTQFGQTIAVGRFMAKGAASEIRYQTLMEHANDAILVVDASGLVLEANHSALALLGRPSSALVGHSYLDFVVPEQRSEVTWETKKVEGRRLLRPDGSIVTADVSVAGVDVGEARLGLAILRDVTEKAALEAQLRQAQKMEAIGRLAGGVAHDFNNILGIITGFGDLAKRQLPPEHPVQGRLDQILKAAMRAGDLTRQMLAFSRRQVMRPKAMSLNDAIEALQSMLGRLIGEDIKVVTRLDPRLGTVIADPTQIDQVLLNLAVNGRDAMESGGTLTFETTNVSLDEDYVRRHMAGRVGSYVMLAVSDTGIGMDEATRTHIFEPFFTTKPEGKGTGMGLATVYGIVKQSDGFIWVYSEPAHGATFKIYLPRVDGPEDQEEPATDALAARRGSETILLVEDQDALREMTQELLQQQGYTVLAAADGEAALRLAARHEGPVDLLFTDVIMPGMNGPQLADRLRALRPAARALYMSGYSNGAVADRGLLAPDANLLEKPFTTESLAKAVRRVLEGT
jgi:PAS domain S-box-containing protein